MRNRAAYRTEVKTRLEDETYEALCAYKVLNGIPSDSEAMAVILKSFLLGAMSRFPAGVLEAIAKG